MSTSLFVVTVIESDGLVLLVRENKPGEPWYLPAGGVQEGETFQQAAVRECREEAGVDVHIERVLDVESRWREAGAWVRVIFAGRVDAAASLKNLADEHSLGAAWVDSRAISDLPLRSPDVPRLVALRQR